MSEINVTKMADLKSTKSYNLKNSSKSDTKSDFFDSFLKNCSNSSNVKKVSVNSSNSNNLDSNDDESYSDKSISSESASNKRVSKSDNDDKSVESKSKLDTDKSDDENGTQEIDVKSLLSMLLSCCKDGSIDFTKLKSELQKLNIPENFQNVIIDFASKIQDSLKGTSANEFVKLLLSNVDKQSTLKGHDELINNIIDALKSKLNEAGINVDTKNDKNSSISNSTLASKINKTAESLESEQNSLSKASNDTLNASLQDDEGKSMKDGLQDSIKGYNQSTLSENNKDSKQNTDTGSGSESADKFLEKLLPKDKDDNKISRVSTFMNQISNVNSSVQAVKGEVQVINKNTFAADIIKSVQYMQANDIKELTVKINPKELGEVVIRLSMENNIMKASISAQNKETYALLQSSLGDMNNSLNDQNIKIQAFSVNIYDDTTYFGGQGSSENKHNNNGENENKDNNRENTTEVKSESNGVKVDDGKVNILV